MVVACAALFFSLTGAGFAASRYIVTSASQIKPSVRHALRGHTGATGPQGIQGPAGATGTPGTVDWNHVYFREGGSTPYGPAGTSLTQSGPDGQVVQTCNPGDHILTGGVEGFNEIVTASAPLPNGQEWFVVAHLDPNAPADGPGRPASGFVEAWVECAAG